MYVLKRDKRFRPVFVMNVNILKTLKCSLDDLSTANDFLLTYCIDRVCMPGKAEAFTMIIDFDGVGLSELPIGNMKGIISAS